jgi:hypothetical protein
VYSILSDSYFYFNLYFIVVSILLDAIIYLDALSFIFN